MYVRNQQTKQSLMNVAIKKRSTDLFACRQNMLYELVMKVITLAKHFAQSIDDRINTVVIFIL